MTRIRKAWELQRELNQAEAREAYFRNRTPRQPTGAVRSRGRSTTLYYRSLTQRQGNDPLVYRVNVLNSTLALVTAADAGLLAAVPTGSFALPLRGGQIQPTKAIWYEGAATPTRQPTDWGTSYIRYSSGPGSHHSIPFSRPTGEFDANDVQTAFNTVFSTNATDLLGAQNGRAQLVFERAVVAVSS